MGIAMQKMFHRIVETPDTPITDVNELEARITDNYKKSCDIALRYANDNVDDNYATMYMDALDTEAEYLIKEYKKIYPNAGNEDMMDETVYNNLKVVQTQAGIVSPNDILNATKMADDDVIYECTIRSFKSGKFVNNKVHIYLDKDYTDRADVFQEDVNMACCAIATALEHIFITVVNTKRI